MKLNHLICAVALLSPAIPAEAQTVQAQVNPTGTLVGTFKKQSSIGWYFTPTSTFFLNAINTRFNPNATNLNRTVAVELWSDRPGSGGSLLRSGSFQSNSALGTFGGAGFAQILLQSGVQYFIGFRNVQGLGRNTTAGGQSLGAAFYSLGPVFTDDLFEIQSGMSGELPHASLELVGNVSTVPEPMTMTLLATGLVAMGGVSILRRRKQRSSL